MTPTYYERASRASEWATYPDQRPRLARNIGRRFEEVQEYRQCVARVRSFPNPVQELWDFVQQKIEDEAEGYEADREYYRSYYA